MHIKKFHCLFDHVVEMSEKWEKIILPIIKTPDKQSKTEQLIDGLLDDVSTNNNTTNN